MQKKCTLFFFSIIYKLNKFFSHRYYFLSGTGTAHVDGVETGVGPGTSVWIPANAEHFCHNTGTEPLKLLYIFARDKFSDVHYCFPSETELK